MIYTLTTRGGCLPDPPHTRSSAKGRPTKTQSEHNRSAFGCIATKALSPRPCWDRPSGRDSSPLTEGSNHALRTHRRADRGHDADWIRAPVAKRGAWANIPPRCNRNEPICFSPFLYRARNLVERFFNKIKHCRRVATRYDKLAANYLAFIQLASIRLWLRVNESTP